MRHGDKVNNLGRKTAHRHALMMNLAISLFRHKRIFTTLAKAKALRGYAEPIISRTKENTTHNRRMVFSLLQDKEIINELFNVIGGKVGERPGGYTRVIKTGFRAGDAAEMAMIELVDFNESYTQNKNAGKVTEPKKKTRRAGGAKKSAGKKKTDATPDEKTEE
ncbi:MAG: 50S ribosomal protein L17 [Bacteroidota bacterium]